MVASANSVWLGQDTCGEGDMSEASSNMSRTNRLCVSRRDHASGPDQTLSGSPSPLWTVMCQQRTRYNEAGSGLTFASHGLQNDTAGLLDVFRDEVLDDILVRTRRNHA